MEGQVLFSWGLSLEPWVFGGVRVLIMREIVRYALWEAGLALWPT